MATAIIISEVITHPDITAMLSFSSLTLLMLWNSINIFLGRYAAHVLSLKIQEGIGVSTVFHTTLFVIFVNLFFGSQVSPLCSYVSRMLITLIFSRVVLHFIGFLLLVCPYIFDFNHPSYERFPSGYRVDLPSHVAVKVSPKFCRT